MTASFECILVQVSPLMAFPSWQIIQNFLKGLRKHLPTKFGKLHTIHNITFQQIHQNSTCHLLHQ